MSLRKMVKIGSKNRAVNYCKLIENKKDTERCRKEGISESLLDRLMLDEARIKKISASIDKVINFNDPIGEVIFGYNLPNGLVLKNIRVPMVAALKKLEFQVTVIMCSLPTKCQSIVLKQNHLFLYGWCLPYSHILSRQMRWRYLLMDHI